jgi:glycosyltransferase involved in cell wall biosynthesis
MTPAIAGSARSLLAPVGRPLRRVVVGARTRGWDDHTHLFAAFDTTGWVLEYEARHLERIASSLGIRVGPSEWAASVTRQSLFHLSQFALLLGDFERRGNRIGVSYFHGRPGTPGMPEFDECFATLSRRHHDVDRVQVTNRAMEGLVLDTGIAPAKVHSIPIGIDLATFSLRTAESCARAREELNVPASAFVVGSFQKDGVGWGEGLEPKLIKGPDLLLAMLERLRNRVPELFVLLTGPARGYVRAGLDRLAIPHRHARLPDIDSLARAYAAIDLCIVTSRDEGGPRAVLESMATGVPLVSTRVGQAADLVRNGENGWLVEVEDVDALVEAAAYVAGAPMERLGAVRRAGRDTAELNSYVALRPRWRDLFEGFVEISQRRARSWS